MVEGKSTEQNFFDLLGAGYTIREASKAVKLTRQELKVIQTHLGE
jgi:methanogenic corrinoid protein MtbC1